MRVKMMSNSKSFRSIRCNVQRTRFCKRLGSTYRIFGRMFGKIETERERDDLINVYLGQTMPNAVSMSFIISIVFFASLLKMRKKCKKVLNL